MLQSIAWGWEVGGLYILLRLLGGADEISRRLDFSTCLFQTLHFLQMRHRALANCFYSFALLQHVVDLIGTLFDLVKFDIASGCDDAGGGRAAATERTRR